MFDETLATAGYHGVQKRKKGKGTAVAARDLDHQNPVLSSMSGCSTKPWPPLDTKGRKTKMRSSRSSH